MLRAGLNHCVDAKMFLASEGDVKWSLFLLKGNTRLLSTWGTKLQPGERRRIKEKVLSVFPSPDMEERGIADCALADCAPLSHPSIVIHQTANRQRAFLAQGVTPSEASCQERCACTRSPIHAVTSSHMLTHPIKTFWSRAVSPMEQVVSEAGQSRQGW